MVVASIAGCGSRSQPSSAQVEVLPIHNPGLPASCAVTARPVVQNAKVLAKDALGWAANTSLQSKASDGRLATLKQSASVEDGSGRTTEHITLTIGGQPGVDIVTSTTHAGATTITVQYGASFTGLKTATFTTSDGKTFQGVVDGRQTLPFTAADTTPKFKDGKPWPSVTVDPPAKGAFTTLLDQAKGACGSDQIVPFYKPGSGTMASCNNCLDDCASALAQCAAGASAILLGCIFPPACGAAVAAAGAALAACDGTSLGCVAYCDAAKCCPKLCGVPNPFDPGSGCCDSGEACVSDSDPNARQGCCPTDHAACGGNCCATGDTCCGNTCCGSGSQCLNGVCCPSTTKAVCNGQCCDGACGADGNCCPWPNHVCGSTCCGAFNSCIQGVCCPNSTDQVINGQCCGAQNVCGKSCCGYGQTCQNGACVALYCPQGQDFCTQPNGQAMCCNLYQCDNPSNDNICTAGCCNGQCCGAGQKCCGGVCSDPYSVNCVPR
jgi:hypothetical protein